MGGLAGPISDRQPAPLLPRYEHSAADGSKAAPGHRPAVQLAAVRREQRRLATPRIPAHELHQLGAGKQRASRRSRRAARPVNFDLFEYGILKKRLWEGVQRGFSEEWRVGHPLIFPGTLLVPYQGAWVEWQFRVPVDDTSTLSTGTTPRNAGAGTTPSRALSAWPRIPGARAGQFLARPHQRARHDGVDHPGPDHRPSRANLGESDRGVAIYRRILLDEQVEASSAARTRSASSAIRPRILPTSGSRSNGTSATRWPARPHRRRTSSPNARS